MFVGVFEVEDLNDDVECFDYEKVVDDGQDDFVFGDDSDGV